MIKVLKIRLEDLLVVPMVGSVSYNSPMSIRSTLCSMALSFLDLRVYIWPDIRGDIHAEMVSIHVERKSRHPRTPSEADTGTYVSDTFPRRPHPLSDCDKHCIQTPYCSRSHPNILHGILAFLKQSGKINRKKRTVIESILTFEKGHSRI